MISKPIKVIAFMLMITFLTVYLCPDLTCAKELYVADNSSDAAIPADIAANKHVLVVAVPDFSSAVPTAAPDATVGAAASNAIMDELKSFGNCRIVERANITKLLGEQGLVISGLVDASTAAKMGELLAADYMIVGSVDSAFFKEKNKETVVTVTVSARLVDIESGEVVDTFEVEGQSKAYKNWEGTYLPLDIEGAKNAGREIAR
ncbi:MAG: CsgG/HfaB family protein, partial [bacterium]